MVALVNGGIDFEGKYFILEKDIDLSNVCSESINKSWPTMFADLSKRFNGTLDGRYHTISNLYINDSHSSVAGLFNVIGEKGTIKCINLVNPYIYCESIDKIERVSIGGITGINYGNIYQCAVISTNENSKMKGIGNISIGWSGVALGGIVGWNFGNIIECSSGINLIASTTGSLEHQCYIGGIAGKFSKVSIKDCYSKGEITSNETYISYNGGLVGLDDNDSSGEIKNSYALCKIYCNGSSARYNGKGGLLGFNYEMVVDKSNCFF